MRTHPYDLNDPKDLHFLMHYEEITGGRLSAGMVTAILDHIVNKALSPKGD